MRNFISSGGPEGELTPRGAARRPAPHLRPAVECLEDRLVPAKIFVHNFNDGASMAFVGNVAPNLRSAVDHSNAGDEIDLDNGTYLLTAQGGGELDVTHNLTIKNNAGGVSTIDGRNQTRVFEIGGGEGTPNVVTMTGLKITHGDGNSSGRGGGIFIDANAQLTLNNDIVTSNSVTGTPAQGAGVFNNGSVLTITNSTISNNRATGSVGQGGAGAADGGGIYSLGGQVTLSNSTVSGNVAQGGDLPGGTLGAGGAGGGLYLDSNVDTPAAAATITATTFANNRAVGGDQTLVGGNGNDTLVGGDGQGGGLYEGLFAGPVSITRSTFSGNQAVGGNSLRTGGSADGGGLYQVYGAFDLSVFNSTFANNATQGGRSGLRSQGPGGVASAGGGLYLAGTGTDLLVNDTIARNTTLIAPGGQGTTSGGGLVSHGFILSNPAQAWNTLIALNVAASGPDVVGLVVSLGHNLVGNPSPTTSFSAARGDLLNISASQVGLGQLANNGGPTQTMALLPGSIALDAGDDAVLTDSRTRSQTTDQRGFPRRVGAHVDIGAFEFVPPPPHHGGRRNGPL